jgi:hypothetical protein
MVHHTTRSMVLGSALALSSAAACGSGNRSVGIFGDEEGNGGGVTATEGSGAGDASAGDGTSASASDGTAGTTDDAEDEGGIKLDVGYQGDVPGACPEGGCTGCTSVDLLFVIDNSGSMRRYQDALALAFPSFANSLVDALPPGTDVHVGITSTEFGFSSQGSNLISNGQCTFTGDGGQNYDAFYVTPDEEDTGRNGAQGRLYVPAGGPAYFEFNTDAGPAELAALADWFEAAAVIGEGGSNIEMTLAPTAWFAHEDNEATNAGFLRDAGSVLVLFWLSDEPDQTPQIVHGQPADQFGLDRVAEAKSQCGGLDCVIASGFVDYYDPDVCDRPLSKFLDALPNPPVIDALPNSAMANSDPQWAADQMSQLLEEALAGVIAQTCDTIPPVG